MHGAASRQAADEPEGTPYHIYTTEFDQVVSAREVPDVMVKANLGVPPGLPPNVQTWPARKAALSRIAESATVAFADAAASITPILEQARGDLALMLLIDQSGSMRDNILAVAASVRWLSELFDEYKAPLSIAGFTTAGWRGGAARRKWIAAGRPKRPGRLCALLHIRYRDFDGPPAAEDIDAMVHPFALCENIDGEAIQWATGELGQRPEPRKLSIVLSDGAPVDDSTLMENGPNFCSAIFGKLSLISAPGATSRLVRSASNIGCMNFTPVRPTRPILISCRTHWPVRLEILRQRLLKGAPSSEVKETNPA